MKITLDDPRSLLDHFPDGVSAPEWRRLRKPGRPSFRLDQNMNDESVRDGYVDVSRHTWHGIPVIWLTDGTWRRARLKTIAHPRLRIEIKTLVGGDEVTVEGSENAIVEAKLRGLFA